MTFFAAVRGPDQHEEPGYWFCFQNDKLMVESTDNTVLVLQIRSIDELGVKPVRTQYLGKLDGIHCFSAELSLTAVWPEGTSFLNLIEAFGKLEEETYKVAVYAQQIVAWDRDHQFCSRCGIETQYQEDERARKCHNCNLMFFPRISPAVMVGIIRENKILLARNRIFAPGFYSVLAGFVDPGEQLEECIVREVEEEVNIQVSNIRYFKSQPWPFPNSLMMAFIADYKAGEIRVDGVEIIEADWFAADELPKCPTGKLSVAGKLIDWFRTEYS